MLYCTFYNKLRKLNPRIRIFGNDALPNNPWGIYVLDRFGTGLVHQTGINPKSGMVYELTERRWDGMILRQGWRRVLNILIKNGVVDRRRAEREFGTSFSHTRGPRLKIDKDPLTKATQEAQERAFQKTGVVGTMDLDDLVDIHRWREKLRQDKTNYWA